MDFLTKQLQENNMEDKHITSDKKVLEMKTRYKKQFSLWQVNVDGSLTSIGLPESAKPFESTAQLKSAILKEVNSGDSTTRALFTQLPLRILMQTAEDFSLTPKSTLYKINEQ